MHQGQEEACKKKEGGERGRTEVGARLRVEGMEVKDGLMHGACVIEDAL